MNEDERQEIVDGVVASLSGDNTASVKTNGYQTQTSESRSASSQVGQTNQEGISTTEYERKPISQEDIDNDPRMKFAKENNIVDYFKSINKEPDPKVLEDIEKKRKWRENAATLAETLRVLSDIGTGFAGGNVYKRDNQDVANINKKADDDRDKHQAKLDEYNTKLLNSLMLDRDQQLKILEDITNKAGYRQINKSESENKTKQGSQTIQNAQTTTTSSQKQDKAGVNTYGSGSGRSGKRETTYVTTRSGVQELTFKPNSKVGFITKAGSTLAGDETIVKDIANRYFAGDANGIVKVQKILRGDKITEGNVNIGEGTSYDPEKLRETMIMEYAQQLEETRKMLNSAVMNPINWGVGDDLSEVIESATTPIAQTIQSTARPKTKGKIGV